MGRLARQLEDDRAARNAARGAFNLQLAEVRGDLDARGVGMRIADRIGEDARDIFEEGIDVADHNRGIIAGTIAALMIWLFRQRIIDLVEHVTGKNEEES